VDARHTLHVTLRYRDIAGLFAPPAVSPFSEDYQVYSTTSGIEFLARELHANPSLQRVEVTILLPPDRVSPELERRTREAVARYCRAQLVRYRQERREQGWYLVREFGSATLGLVVFLGAARFLYATDNGVLALLGEGLNIAGWVLFWFPLDTFFYTLRHQRMDEKIYERLLAMSLTISAIETEPRDGRVAG
jgi:hypothetical protein